MLDRVCSVMKQLIQNRRSVETLTIESATKTAAIALQTRGGHFEPAAFCLTGEGHL